VPKARQPWLKQSLCTKDEKRARVLSKPVMMEFDRILAKAETLVAERPMRTELTAPFLVSENRPRRGTLTCGECHATETANPSERTLGVVR
jgi:hypothetical protein